MHHLLVFLLAAVSWATSIHAAAVRPIASPSRRPATDQPTSRALQLADPILPREEAATTTTMPTKPPTRGPLRAPDPRGPLCHVPGGPSNAFQSGIRADIQYLRALGPTAPCTGPPGPRASQLVACQRRNAVWLRNDRPAELVVPCGVVADYAQAVLDACGFVLEPGDVELVEGQLADVGADGNDGDPGPGWGGVVVGSDDDLGDKRCADQFPALGEGEETA